MAGAFLCHSRLRRIFRKKLPDIHAIAESDDVAKMKKKIKKSKIHVDVQDTLGRTPLMLATSEQMVKLLIDAGANIYIEDNDGKSALRKVGTCMLTDEKILQHFFEKVKSDCSSDKEKIAQTLIDARWSLYKVVEMKDSDVTRILLQRSFPTEIYRIPLDCELHSLHVAVRNVDVENVKLLLEYNAKVNRIDVFCRTPLACVLFNCNRYPDKTLSIMEMLLDRGADVTSDNYPTRYHLHNLLNYANSEMIKLLFLKRKIDLSFSDGLGSTGLHALAANKNPGVIDLIHGKIFDINSRDKINMTPLMVAAQSGIVHAVEFLLNEGADIEASDWHRKTAIYFAIDQQNQCEERHKRCVQLLLERGAIVDSPRCISRRPERRLEIFDLLFEDKQLVFGKIVISHVALQVARGAQFICVSKINARKKSKDYFESCKRKLFVRVFESLTLFDLVLHVTDEKFERYVRNEEFVLKVGEFCKNLIKNFYYYNSILERQLRKAILKMKAVDIVCRVMQTNYDSFPMIVDDIIGYLQQCDMQNLIDAFA